MSQRSTASTDLHFLALDREQGRCCMPGKRIVGGAEVDDVEGRPPPDGIPDHVRIDVELVDCTNPVYPRDLVPD
jgi:hypothetical protein